MSVLRTVLEQAGYFAKAVLQKLLRDSDWVRSQRKARREIAFRLDASGHNLMAAE